MKANHSGFCSSLSQCISHMGLNINIFSVPLQSTRYHALSSDASNNVFVDVCLSMCMSVCPFIRCLLELFVLKKVVNRALRMWVICVLS